MLQAIQDSAILWLSLWGMLGLICGSFVNVVIYRLPRMLEREWRQEALSILQQPCEDDSKDNFNLITPRSFCTNCGHKITALENIPVLSYMFLHGRCGACRAAIPISYPAVELLCALTAVCCAYVFGFGWQAAAAAVLTWALVALAIIDLQHGILPDSITLPILWLGLLLNIFALFVPLQDAVWGAIAGYMAPWMLFHTYRLISGKEGMGYGDFKLLALLGAWLGWSRLPVILMLAAAAGICYALVRGIVGYYKGSKAGSGLDDPMPFGPSLVIAGWSVFMLDIDFSVAAGITW